VFHPADTLSIAFTNAGRILVPIVAVLSLITNASCQQLVGDGQTPLSAAKESFERKRDDEHRRRMRLVWSDEEEEPLPTSFEAVFMNVGYGGDEFLLLQCSKEAAKVSIAKSEKYLDSVTYFTANTTTDELLKLWRTIGYLQGLKVEEAIPHAVETQSSITMYSHGSNHLVVWREDAEAGWKSRPILSSKGTINGIRNLDELKTSAITSLLWGRFASEVWLPDSDRMAQDNWRSYWRDILPEICNPSEVEHDSTILIESACDMLSAIGEPSDADLLLALASRMQSKKESFGFLSDATSAWPIESLKKAILFTTSRISLRRNWDSQVALLAIRNSERRLNIDRNQDKWLRERYCEGDSQGYHKSLLEDLKNPRADLVETSIKELADRYPGEHREEFHRLLEHADPDVVFTSALALAGRFDKGQSQKDKNSLGAQAERDPLIRDALRALKRLSSDSSISIRPEVSGFIDHARNRAIDFLRDRPAPWGWDVERCRRQLEDPKEVDGRVIEYLLFELHLPKISGPSGTPVVLSVADRDRLISTWRRCLNAPYNKGTVLAMEELIALRDLDSLPLMRRMHSEFQSGCAPSEIDGQIPEVAFPWLTRYDVGDLEAKIIDLAVPAESP